jgi:exopolysaccharide biosynthesis polyprenyl glycosylphosphotransferase
MIDQRKRIFAVNCWILDLLLTAASFYSAYTFRMLIPLQGHTVMPVGTYLWLLAIILPTWAILLPLFSVYSNVKLRPLDQILKLTKAIVIAWLVMATAVSLSNNDAETYASSRGILVLTLVINYVVLVSSRILMIRLKRPSALDVRHVAVVGYGKQAHDLARKIEEEGRWGYKLVGVFGRDDVKSLVKRGGIDEIIIVADKGSLEDFTDTFVFCEQLGITTRIVLNFFPHAISRVEFHQFEGFPLLSFSTAPTNEALLLVRRVMDIIVAVLLGIPALFVTLPCAILIKLTSKGPALFKQQRCGLNGRVFTMYKLRSMVNSAEQLRVEIEGLNEMDGPVFKSSRDPRITAMGRFIRRFSIDELPQLYNVLRGEMSLVGPRPPLPEEVACYEHWQRRRLSMKPGLTCLWQISGRNEVSFQDWMKLDLSYIDNWSLLLDLKILLKTVPTVLTGKGIK